jgi:hypothetical protein
MHAIDAATGSTRINFPAQLGSGAIHSTPVLWSGSLWVGSDAGDLLRVDSTSGEVLARRSLCFAACTSDDAIYGSVSIDLDQALVAIAVNGRLHQVDLSCTDMACNATAATYTDTRARVWSSPSLDWQNGRIYVAHDNKLFKRAWPLSIAGTFASVATGGTNADPSYPRSTPMLWSNQLFVGDGGGYMNRFEATAGGELGAPSVSDYQGSTVDTTPVIDYSTGGNLYYGTRGTSGNPSNGAVVQLTRAF